MTTTFTDAIGRRWNIRITIPLARKVREATAVDLIRILDDPDVLERRIADPIDLGEILWHLVQPAAEDAGVDQEGFEAALFGDAIPEATECLLNALIEFLPPNRGSALRKILDRVVAAEAEAERRLMQIVADGTLDQRITEVLTKAKTGYPAIPDPTAEPPAEPARRYY